MDHVYVCRDGRNEELRYSLRSLDRFVTADRVCLVGGWPGWVTGARLFPRRPSGDAHSTTTAHLRFAVEEDEISDPFVLWMDDVYATEPVPEVPVLHNGPVGRPSTRTAWHRGQRATARWLRDNGFDRPLSYELHVPLVVHKDPMREVLARLGEVRDRAPHKRTMYGNLAGLGGAFSRDVKVMSRSAKVEGPWLSSADATFGSAVLPRLLGLLPEPSRFER